MGNVYRKLKQGDNGKLEESRLLINATPSELRKETVNKLKANRPRGFDGLSLSTLQAYISDFAGEKVL